MDSIIILNWNKIVNPCDTGYIIGDFAFDDHDKYLHRMNGTKVLIVGNHDHTKRRKKATGWSEIEHLKRIEVDGEYVILCHYAMRTWYKSHRGALHLYGHSHGNLPGDSQSCDVGVDCWNFKPVTLAEAKLRMATFPQRVELDHHKPGKVDDEE